ncbi:hypothetical protein [Lactobacillus intestinalis]|uniref:hypothetical protein n=1 Tax=Lactobacillus intestinalis TaxID=151781 RepID=UPI00266F7422|nr:hypothetical protein [Lactobacillus intestinalis]
MKYYEVYPAGYDDPYEIAVVLAENSGKAKSKYLNGETIPYFSGFDPSGCEFTDLRSRRLNKLDGLKPDDSFNIIKTLILEYYWDFYSATDNIVALTSDNFTNKRLREYLKMGDIDDFD